MTIQMKHTLTATAAAFLMLVTVEARPARAQIDAASLGTNTQKPSSDVGREDKKSVPSSANPPARPLAPHKDAVRSRPVTKKHPGMPVRSLPPDVLKGVQTVRVSAESSTIKVGLARLGQVAIEFPSADRVYKVSPAPEEFVSTNKVVFTRNDPVILYPGTGFVVPKGRATADPATILTIQMFSGLIVAVHVYPVESLAENATRVYVNYDRAVVVNARRAAGLPVNFDQIIEAEDSERKAKAQKPALVAAVDDTAEQIPEGAGQNATVKTQSSHDSEVRATAASALQQQRTLPSPSRPNYVLIASAKTPFGTASPLPSSDDANKALKAEDVEREFLSRVAQRELAATIKLGMKGLGKFTAPKYGLSVASGRSKEVDARHRSVVIAVRNTLREPVRLVPEQPDLAVVTLSSDRPTDSAPVALTYRETTVKDNRLAAGEIGYFAVIFETPILGVQQILSAKVAQIFAADAPASLDLVISAR